MAGAAGSVKDSWAFAYKRCSSQRCGTRRDASPACRERAEARRGAVRGARTLVQSVRPNCPPVCMDELPFRAPVTQMSPYRRAGNSAG